MLEIKHIPLKHKQLAEVFNNMNALQMEGGLITKNYGPKIYLLLRLGFSTCLSTDQKVLHPSLKREKKRNTSAMDVESDLKLTMYINKKIMMNGV